MTADETHVTDRSTVTRAMVLHIEFRSRVRGRNAGTSGGRTPASRLGEAVGAGGRHRTRDRRFPAIVALAAPHPSTLLGPGKVGRNATASSKPRTRSISWLWIAQLSPVQQRNLEKAFKRQGARPHRADLEIFGERARTREGALQVEHAHLTYQKGRLVRLVDASRAPARRLRLSRRAGRNPDRIRPPPDRGAIARIEGDSRRQAHPQAAPRQPQADAVSDRRAGRLHQCRQVDAVQPR